MTQPQNQTDSGVTKRGGGEEEAQDGGSHSLHPSKGARLQAREYSHTSRMLRSVRRFDVHRMACRGLVITM